MANSGTRRWQLIRENLSFQIKLMLDAVRDVLLSPVAIVCTILDLAAGNHSGQGYFQRLMNIGHQSDHWLNLFGDSPNDAKANQADKDVNQVSGSTDFEPEQSHEASLVVRKANGKVDSKIESLFSQVEELLSQQSQQGNSAKVTKEKIDHYLDSIMSRQRESNQDVDASLEGSGAATEHNHSINTDVNNQK